MSNKRNIRSNGIRKSVSQKLGICGPLLAFISNGSSGMNSRSSGSWPPGSISGLCGEVVGSGNGNIGVKGGNCSIGVGHQLGIGRSLSVIDSRMKDSVGSLCGKMIGSGNGNIGVVWD